MQDALTEFQGTPEEIRYKTINSIRMDPLYINCVIYCIKINKNLSIWNRIAVANADLALGRGEVDSALNILTMIGPEQIYFIQVTRSQLIVKSKDNKKFKYFAQI